MTKKILILAANPRSDLRLDYEIKDLKDAIKRNKKFDVEIELAVDAESIDNLIAENQPLIVHFCGHGAGEQGLVVLDKKGIEKSLSNEVLADIFQSYSEGIECVLLNACYTEVQADVIAEYIPYVIGTSREILDEVAHYFSIGFYKGIAEEQPIETCYEWGYVSIKKNLENAEVVTSIDEIDGKSRKLEVVNDGTVESTVEPLEIILKHNKFLESQFASNVSPQLEQEFIEEGRRKRYKDNLRNILNNFGQRIIHRAKQIDDFELKQRRTLIDKVQDFWIKGFLKPSLYFNTATDIDNDHPSGQILRPLDNLEVIPFDIEQSYDSVKDTDIPDQISNGQTLLILGEPGSGKTIALLQLAERLVAESRENSKKPIPVVFNLSSWVEKQLSLEAWLIEELRDKYQVPKAWSKSWIERQELTLLLDGLDEVKANHRNACVRAIQEFSSTHQATEMVVCSRIKDYEALVERLLLSSVICIQPLSKQQLLDFLENADDSLSGLKTVIKQDSGIFQFATTPLILNMMTWTYHGWSRDQCYEQFQNPEYREFNLFESYINQNFARDNRNKKYSKKQIINWLTWLSKPMIQESQIIFLIENLQTNILEHNIEKIECQVSNFILAAIIIGSLVIVTQGLVLGLIFGLFSGLFALSSLKITLYERIVFSGQRDVFDTIYQVLLGTIIGFFSGVIVGFFMGIKTGMKDAFMLALILGILIAVLMAMLFWLSSLFVSEINTKKTEPNQGICLSFKNSLLLGFIAFFMSILIVLLLFFFDKSNNSIEIYPAIIMGAFFWLINGGATCIKHFNLRRILYHKGCIPWNYAHFLDYASELLLMKKVGGGYVFYHRMLMEHFANIKLEQ